ncbi:MAG: choice-of-anchor D domain-containing protein [Myxococcota bacterium]
MRISVLPLLLLAGCPEPEDPDTGAPELVPLQEVTPLQVDFGEVEIGRSAPPRQVTINNPGTAALDVYEIRIPPDDESEGFRIGSIGQSQRIRPGNSGTFVVELTPNGPGLASSVVVIESNVTPAGEALLIPVRAEVVQSMPEFTPAEIRVADASQSARVAIEIRNVGRALLEVRKFDIEGSPAFTFDLDPDRNGTLPLEIDTVVDGTGRPVRTVFVEFDPALAEGGDTGELVISTNEYGMPKRRIPLSVQ